MNKSHQPNHYLWIRTLLVLLSLLTTRLSCADPLALQTPVQVLIVGAGPCGLCVAKAFQNNGIYPDIIEKEDQIRSDGAGIGIPANGSWALDQLGISIASKALLIDHMQFTDDQGELLTQEKIDTLHPKGAQFYSLERNTLMKQLLSCLSQQTVIQTSVTIKKFTEENDRVKVEFSNGQIKSYDLVIGCDGIYSTLRSQIHPQESPEFLGLAVWRAVIETPENVKMPTYMLGSDRLVLLYPLPNHKLYVYGHVFQSLKAPFLDTFSTAFSSFGGAVPEVICYLNEQAQTSNEVKFYLHHMEKSHSVRFQLEGFKRILLVGDASHAFGPMLQNGAAQAFEDAYVIQDLCVSGLKADCVPAFIEAFEKRRKARVQTVFDLSNAKIQAISDPQQIQGRNQMIRQSGAPNVKGFKLIMNQNP